MVLVFGAAYWDLIHYPKKWEEHFDYAEVTKY